MNTLYVFFLAIRNWTKKWPRELTLCGISLIYLSVFSFVPNNKFLLLVTFLLLLSLYALLKNIIYASLYVYIFLLPFQNGKGMDFLVVPAEYVYRNTPFIMTPTITMSSLMIILLFYLLIREKFQTNSKKTREKLLPSDISLFIFFISHIVSFLRSDIPLLSFLLTVQIWGYMLMYFYIREYRLEHVVKSYFLPITLSLTLYEGVWSILQRINNGPLGTWAENNIDPSLITTLAHVASEDRSFFRMQGTFSHPNFLGYFMACTVPILLYVSISTHTSLFMRRASAIGCLIGSIGLALSASRASWIIALIAIICVVKLPNIRTTISIDPIIRRFYIICLMLFAIAIPFIILPRLMQLAITIDPSGGAKFRWDLILYTMKIAIQHPLGIGLGMFPKILLEEIGGFTSFPTQPHNLIAQILSAFGYIGSLSFLGFLYMRYKECTKSDAKNGIVHVRAMQSVYRISFGVFFALSMFYPILTEQQLFGWLWILLTIIA